MLPFGTVEMHSKNKELKPKHNESSWNLCAASYFSNILFSSHLLSWVLSRNCQFHDQVFCFDFCVKFKLLSLRS